MLFSDLKWNGTGEPGCNNLPFYGSGRSGGLSGHGEKGGWNKCDSSALPESIFNRRENFFSVCIPIRGDYSLEVQAVKADGTLGEKSLP